MDILGPLCTAFENLANMESSFDTDGVIQLDATSVHNFVECIKHALMLTGDVASQISTTRRELVLKKINPLMVLLAQEEFSNTNKSLFGPGFEQRLKTKSETAEPIGKAVRAGKPFFVGRPPRDSDTDSVGGGGATRFQFQDLLPIQCQREHNIQQRCWEPRPQLISTISKPQSFKSQQ